MICCQTVLGKSILHFCCKIKGLFHRIFDNDNDGYITKDELREVLRSMDFTISDEDLEQMMFEADIDGNNKVRFLV